MRYLSLLASMSLSLILAGCGGVTTQNYQREDNSNRQEDMDNCMAEATREVPPRPDYAGIDLNYEIRMRYFNDCMTEKGYTIS